jgi:hypothetical protein
LERAAFVKLDVHGAGPILPRIDGQDPAELVPSMQSGSDPSKPANLHGAGSDQRHRAAQMPVKEDDPEPKQIDEYHQASAAPAPQQPAGVSSAPEAPGEEAAETNTVTLSQVEAAKLFPRIRDYSQHTNEQLHEQNVNNLDEFRRKREDIEKFAYDVLLPGFNAAIERIKRGEVLNGCTDVGAYFESIGFRYATVRKWKQRFNERTFKPLLNAAPGKPETVTPEQRELREALMQQGYKKLEAERLAKEAQGNNLIERFNWVMAHRAGQIKGTANAESATVGNAAAEQFSSEPAASVGEPTAATAIGIVTTVSPTDGEPGNSPEIECLAEVPPSSRATYGDWEKNTVPAPKFKRRYFTNAADAFKRSYGLALQSAPFKKILSILKNKTQQVLSNADDFAQLATLIRGAGDHLKLLAAVMTTSSTLLNGTHDDFVLPEAAMKEPEHTDHQTRKVVRAAVDAKAKEPESPKPKAQRLCACGCKCQMTAAEIARNRQFRRGHLHLWRVRTRRRKA